jgi:signal transduction histidine kinase
LTKRLFFVFTLFLVLNQSFSYAKEVPELKIKISAIQEDAKKLNENEWSNFSLQKDKTLYIGFEASGSGKDPIFYKIFLDGVILEPKLIDNYYSMKSSLVGTHILKIVAFTLKGMESNPILLPFSVIDAKPVQQSVIEKPKQQEIKQSSPDFLKNPILLYALSALLFLFLIVIVILLKKRKPGGGGKKNNLLTEELKEMQHAYNRVKEELHRQADENTMLRERVKELDSNVKYLENANVHLVEQKEKLTEGKNKLELLNTQKEELFASVIHDIKNPASAIRGYIELLNSYELNANEQQEIMQSLVASSEDIMKLSQDMCAIIAKALPEPKLKFKKGSLKNIIDDVFSQNASYAKVKQVKLFNKSSIDLPELNMDMEKIEEALDNLVNNAIKYAPPETIVEIRSYIEDLNKKLVVIEVKDNGVGLSEEDLKKSFLKGSILSAKPTGLEQSSGLGLWIVKRIIEEHNGKVKVESKLGIGSTFSFELPYE